MGTIPINNLITNIKITSMSSLADLAFPFIEPSNHENGSVSAGLTKHELGAFMIAQGLVGLPAKFALSHPDDQDTIAKLSKEIAGKILSQF